MEPIELFIPEKTTYHLNVPTDAWTKVLDKNTCDEILVVNVNGGRCAVVVADTAPTEAIADTATMIPISHAEFTFIKNSGKGVWIRGINGANTSRGFACLQYERYTLPFKPVLVKETPSTVKIDVVVSQPKQLASNVGAPIFSYRASQAGTAAGNAADPTGAFTDQTSGTFEVAGLIANRQTKIEIKATNGIGDSATNLLITTRTTVAALASAKKGKVHIANLEVTCIRKSTGKTSALTVDVTCKRCLKRIRTSLEEKK